MYNPEEDIIPYELLQAALQISNVPPLYKVYFDKETGNILSITNEESFEYTNSIELEYDLVKDFFIKNKSINDHKVIFIDQTTPAIVNKNSEDVDTIMIEEVEEVTHWNNTFTIENYPLLKKWGFQLRPDQKEIFKKYNLSTLVEIFIVNPDNFNLLIRAIKVQLSDLLYNDKFYVEFNSDSELNNKKIFVKKFFSTTGYQVLYDTEI
jgi:hypothetical protein